MTVDVNEATVVPRKIHPGDTIGEFVVERVLGGGGMGQVYLARDPRLDRLVAVKLLHSALAVDEEADARFRREARALSRIVHPNVVGIHTFGRWENAWFLAMEYVEGQSLDARLRAGPLPLKEALTINRQVAGGLQEAHALGIVHRDVKPANVLLRALASGGQLAKVCDFGLARQFLNTHETAALTQTASILGTPSYMAPEQIQAQAVDGRTDLYALAVMLYQMLTGHVPYKREGVQQLLIAHLLDQPPPMGEHVPELVQAEILKALAKDPAERHATVLEFVEALDVAANVTARLGREGTCPACQHPAPAGDGFCAHCGGPIPTAHCTHCGTKREGERYRCAECGASLVPWTAHGGAAVGGMRTATAVVLVARLDSAEVDVQAHADFAEAFATAVAREGGRTAALVGREAIALWGLGGMADDDAAAALDAALALPARLANAEAHGALRAVRAAVELGQVASRGVGVAFGTALAGGDAVERARVAAARCGPGQVVIGERALRDVRGLFEIAGDARRQVRIVLRRRDASLALADYVARDVARPLVGRDVELGLLTRAARKVRRDHGLVAVAVRGPQDVGKSRLCGELLRHLETSDSGWRMHVLRVGGETHTSWHGLADVVRAALPPLVQHKTAGQQKPGSEEELPTRLAQLPGLSEGDPARVQRRVVALQRMLGLHAGTQTPEPASEAELQAAFEAWVALIHGLCARQPMVWVLEGLDRARPLTASLIGHILRNCEDVPLLVLLPLRDDRCDAALQALRLPPAQLTQVELDALDRDEIQQLAAELLDGFVPPQELVDALQRFSDGVPGRIEQAIETLVDEKVLIQKTNLPDSPWSLQSAVQAAGLLERSMSELLLRRIGRLAPPERLLLDALAVAGGVAPVALLSVLAEREIGDADLTRLQQAGLLTTSRTQQFVGHREVALRQEAATALLTERQPRPVRADLHKRAATWLEAWTGPRPQAFGALLAWHHEEAGNMAGAARQLLRNGEQAVRAFATRDAFEAFLACVSVAQQWRQQEPQEALPVLVQALVGMAETGLRCGELPQALDAAVQAVELALQRPDLGDLRVRARRLRGQVLDSMGKPDEAIACLRQAVDDARSLQHGFAASILAISLIAMVLQRRGRHAESVQIAEQALLQCENVQDLDEPELHAGIGRLHTWLGHAASRAKDFDKARAAYRSAEAAFLRSGEEIGAAMAQLSLGNVAYRAGDLAEAARVYRAVVQTCRQLDDLLGAATAETNLGNALLDLGRHAEALTALRASERTQRLTGRLENLPETLRLIALALATQSPQEAREVGQEALELAQKMGQTAAVSAVTETLGKL